MENHARTCADGAAYSPKTHSHLRLKNKDVGRSMLTTTFASAAADDYGSATTSSRNGMMYRRAQTLSHRLSHSSADCSTAATDAGAPFSVDLTSVRLAGIQRRRGSENIDTGQISQKSAAIFKKHPSFTVQKNSDCRQEDFWILMFGFWRKGHYVS